MRAESKMLISPQFSVISVYVCGRFTSNMCLLNWNVVFGTTIEHFDQAK